ncbi:acetyltransferase [Glutamicibacter uratoxydans]|uniref:Acetyltransferase n=1 Tax=Glutamicibacter uratoxydans TaxID=43667 RepID=A0A4Y4DP48_GLUUR|nr:GNAT family protein [Glutamicibacter uratoxydans]GED05128.1 acetyltransferase [Glutamicibacter uratoxydans]
MTDALNKVAWPVHTQRLRLRRLEADDLLATWRYRQLPEVYEWITSGPTELADYERLYFEEGRRERDVAVELVDEQGAATLIGTVMVKVHDGWGQSEVVEQTLGVEAELGWSFDPAYSGLGYATEAVQAVIELCFGALGLRRLTAECFAANEPSYKLMERVGMRREAYSRASGLHRSGQWMDGMVYALLADEWEGTAAG